MGMMGLLLAFTNQMNAQIITWELSGLTGVTAGPVNSTTSVSGIGTGQLSRGAGLTATSLGGGFNSSGWFSSATPTTLGNAISNNDYYQFTVPVTDATATITAVSFYIQASNTGPNTATLRSSVDDYATDLGTFSVTTSNALQTVTFATAFSNQTGTVTFRLYGYGSAAGSSPATGGTLRIGTSSPTNANDISVAGTVTPSATPTLTSNPTGLTLTYVEGSGPANGQFTLSGSNLTASGTDGTIGSGSANVLVSTDNSTFAQSVPFSYASPTFSQTVYTRLVAGLSVNASYNTTLTSTAGSGGPSTTTAITASVTAPGPTDCGTNTAIGTVRASIPAQSSFTGSTATVQGTVTAVFGTGKFYVQDATGGLAIFTANVVSTNAIALGDVVQVTGRRVRFNGEAELDQVSCVTKQGTATVPAPVVFDAQNPGGVTLLSFLTTNEGTLVQIKGVNFGGGGNFSGNTNFPFTACSNEPGEVRVDASATGLIGTAVPTVTSSVTGVVGHFINASATADRLQTFPRSAADLSSEGVTACSTENTSCGVPSVTTSETALDVATWNAEWLGNPGSNFGPSNKTLQQTNAETVLKGIGSDVFMLEEISGYNAANPTDNPTAFGKLIAALNTQFPTRNYTGECSPRYSYSTVASPDPFGQRVCIIYRQDQITKVSSTPLLTDFNTSTYDTFWPADPGEPSKFWGSGRLPFLFVGDVTLNGTTQRVHFVGLHAKAQTDTSAYNRRRQDVRALYNLLATQYPTANLIMAGDYNDDTDLSIAGGGRITSYAPFVYANPLETAVNGTRPNPQYTNLTKKFSDLGTCASTTSFTDFIDHFTVSNEIRTPAASGSGSAGTGLVQYVDNSVQVIKPAISGYANTTSDHYPVYAQFSVTAPITYTLTPASVALSQGQTLSTTTIATVNDASSLPGGASVSASATNNGVSVSNISLNTSTGAITADVSATCTATNASFTLTLNGSGATTAPTATLNVTVNPLTLTAAVTGSTTVCAGYPVIIRFTGTYNSTVTYNVNGGDPQTLTLVLGQFLLDTGPLSTTTTYNLVSSALNGCEQAQTGSAIVTVKPVPTISVSAPATVCYNSPAQITFTGTPGAIVHYSLNGSDLYSPLDETGSLLISTGNLTFDFQLTLYEARLDGCSSVGPYVYKLIDVAPPTNATVFHSTLPICSGSTTMVEFFGTAGALVTYNINGGSAQTILIPGTVPGAGSAFVPIGPLSETTTVSLVSVSFEGCTYPLTNSATINLKPIPTASIGGGGTGCVGSSISVNFSGTPNASVTYNRNGSSNSIQLNGNGIATIQATTSSTFELVGVSLNGCMGTVSGGPISVTVTSLPTTTISGGGSACTGGSVAISFSGAPNATVSYYINKGSLQTILLNGSGSASLSATASGTYALVSVSLGECSQAASGSVSVTINPAPTASISGGGSACVGGSVAVNFTGTPNATVTYTLNGGSNQTISLTGSGTASFQASASATYALVSVGNGTCSQNLTGSVSVTITSLPTASISGGASACAGGAVSVAFTGTLNATVTYTVNGDSNQTILLNGELNGEGIATLLASASGTYSLVSVSLGECSQAASGSAIVTINPTLTASLTGGGSACTGESVSVNFTGTPNTTVTYTVNGGGNQTISLNGSGTASLSATASGTYGLVSVNLGKCSQAASGSVSVTVNPAPTASISGGGSACVGGSVAVNFTGTPNATVTYTVNGGGNQTILLNGEGTASLSATASGTYALISVSLGECSQAASGSVTVTINPAPTASISGSGSACAGGSVAVNFTGTPNATVTYTVNGGGNQTISLNGEGTASLSATASGTYSLVSVSLGECSQAVSGSVSVTINPAPTASISGGGSACTGGSVSVNFTGTPNATVTYTLNGGGNQTISLNGEGTASLSATASGTYALVSVSLGECSQAASGSVTVTINPAPTASISGGGSACTGSSVSMNFTGTPNATVTYTLNGGSNQTISLNGEGTASLLATTSGTYALVSVSDGTCSQSQSGSVSVTITSLPTASISGGGTTCTGGSVAVNFTGTPNATVTYSVGGSNQTILLNGDGTASLQASASGTYSLVSVALSGCSQAASGSVSVVLSSGRPYTSTPTVTGAPACAGATIRVSFTFTSSCAFPDNVFTAELSDPSGSFETVTELGTVAPGINTLSLPISLPTGSGYRVRIRASQPEYVSGASAAFTVNAPGFSSTPTVSSDNKCAGEAVRLSFTVGCAFPAGSVFTAQISNASGSFENPTEVGTVRPGLNNVTIPAGTPAGTGYRLRVVNSSNPTLYSAVSGGFKVKACGTNREIAPEETGLRVNVSPNPSPEGKLRIHISGAEGQALRVELFNGTGLNVRQQVIGKAETEEALEWDITRQPQGLYLLRVSGQRETKTVKVLH